MEKQKVSETETILHELSDSYPHLEFKLPESDGGGRFVLDTAVVVRDLLAVERGCLTFTAALNMLRVASTCTDIQEFCLTPVEVAEPYRNAERDPLLRGVATLLAAAHLGVLQQVSVADPSFAGILARLAVAEVNRCLRSSPSMENIQAAVQALAPPGSRLRTHVQGNEVHVLNDLVPVEKAEDAQNFKGGTVYFLITLDETHIKIGFTDGPVPKRVEALSTGNHIGIRALASMPGTLKFEKSLHKRFAHLRSNGEWFRVAPELLQYIREFAS